MRTDHRLKVNVDYSITLKYGEAHLLCAWMFLDTLLTGGIEFATTHTYEV